MAKDKNIEMKQAYVGNKSHIKCEFGEFIQPLTVTNNNNVTIQGLEIATEKDNVINKNIPYKDGKGAFGICKNGGNCQFKAMEKVKWENVNENVYVGDARTLNGKSFFRCPYVAGQNIEIIEHNQQAIGAFSEKNEESNDDKTPNPLELIGMLLKFGINNLNPLTGMKTSYNFMKNLFKELGYAAEVGVYMKSNEIIDGAKNLKNNIKNLIRNPSIENCGKTLISGWYLNFSLLSGINPNPISSAKQAYQGIKNFMKNPDFSIQGIIKFGNEEIDRIADEKLKPIMGRKIRPEAYKWYKDTAKQISLGAGAKEATLLGTVTEVGIGFVPGLGWSFDARDLAINLEKGDGWGATYSALGVIPMGDILKKGPKVLKNMAKNADEAISAINKVAGTNITPRILDSIDEIAVATKKGAKAFTETMGNWKARNTKALSQLASNSMIVSKMNEFKAFKQRLICVFTKGNCFVKGTLVKTEYGHKEIEKIEIGERVLSLNTKNNKLEYKVVLNTLRSKTIKTILFEFEDNIIVETTPDHKFFVLDKGFVRAKNMCENDIVLDNKFKGTRLNKINEIYYFEKDVYNLYVEDNNNYFVTEKGLLVHNKMMSYADIMEWLKQVSEIIDNQNLKFRLNEDDFKEALKTCFTYKTLIYGKNTQKIGDIEVNDIVYSFNEIEEKIEEKKVVNVFKHKVYKILELFLENGEKIETTLEHPFYVNGNYIPAGDLVIGSKIFTSELKNIELIEKREIFYKNGIKVYNFEVEDNHNYFVGKNKFLVHNTKKLFHTHNLDLLKQIDGIPYSESWLDNWIKTNTQKPRNRVPFFIIDPENPSKSVYGYKKGDFYMLSSNHLKTNLSLDEMNRTIDNFCFTAETYIFGKKIKLIKDINIDDEVYSYNEKNKKIELKKVINVFKHKTNKILELFLENGERIETTPEHPFYVNGNYIPAGDLVIGSKIFTSELKNIELIEKREIYYKNEIEVYNFEVEDNHNYFVGKNKILVHNTKERFYNMENFNYKKLNNTNPKAETWFRNQKEGFIVPNEKGEWLYGWNRGDGDRAIIITNANGNAIFNSQLPALEIPGINGKTKGDLNKLYSKISKAEKKSGNSNFYFGKNADEVKMSFENYGITGNHLNENYGTSSAKHGFNFPSKIEHNPDHLGVNHSGGAAQLNNNK